MYRALVAGAATLIAFSGLSIAQAPPAPEASTWENLPINNLADCFGMALVISQRVGSPPLGENTIEDCKKKPDSCMIIWALQKPDALIAMCHVSDKVMSMRKATGFLK